MTDNKHIFTHTRFGLDSRTWLCMLILGIISLGLLSYKIANQVNCSEFEIKTKAYSAGDVNSYYLGEEIKFFATAKDAKHIEWNFGDKQTAKGDTVNHIFLTEGTYIVTATSQGRCMQTITINIKEFNKQPSTSIPTIEDPIICPNIMYAKEPISFSSNTVADSYEWTVLNTPEFPTQNSAVATYIFPIAGTRIIELKLDGTKTFRKTIQVLAPIEAPKTDAVDMNAAMPIAPPPLPKDDNATADKADKPKALVIANEEFVTMLNEATEGKKDVQSFNQFLCDGANTKVLTNGTEWETLGSFHQKIYGKKRYDIKSVDAVRDENNCVKILKIKYKKRTLGIF